MGHIDRLDEMVDIFDLCADDRAALRWAVAEIERLRQDAARLDWLESESKTDPILLHNLSSGSDFPRHPRGLGLTPWQPRTLRAAIDAARGKR